MWKESGMGGGGCGGGTGRGGRVLCLGLLAIPGLVL